MPNSSKKISIKYTLSAKDARPMGRLQALEGSWSSERLRGWSILSYFDVLEFKACWQNRGVTTVKVLERQT